MKVLPIIISILFLFAANELNAQTQLGLSYQAVIRNAEGQPITDESVIFRISLTNSAGSAIHFQEEHTVTTNSYGLATLVIGGGSLISGSYSAVPWKDGIFLKVEVKVGANPYTQFEVQRLNAVPYANYALNGVSDAGLRGQTVVHDGANWVANGNIVVTDSSVNIVPKANHNLEQPIFCVLNSSGEVVFAVYESGVRSYVGSGGAKGTKGGFAVGGLSGTKGSVEYFRITPDSARIYIDNTSKKAKGGFAVGGLSGTKGLAESYFKVTPDSTYFSNTILTEGDVLVAGNLSSNVGIADSSLTDVDGNIYKTVKIGTQVWMAENLRTIATPADSVLVYNNSTSTDTINAFGRLYAYGLIQMATDICPTGWHVPNALEWKTLFAFVGGVYYETNNTEIGIKLSEAGFVGNGGYWADQGMGFYPTNSTGFSARPGGSADYSEGWYFNGMGTAASFWVNETAYPQMVRIDGYQGYTGIQEGSTVSASSIRCIKD